MSAPEVFRTPEDRFENLPGYDFRPNDADAYGLRMHYSDAGPRDGMPIVCFHGQPTWAYLYRKMIAPLVGGGHQAIVPDYAGFGRSDKPTDRGWCTYDRHVELVTAVRGGLGPRNAAVVVQVWGGPIELRWAVEHVENVAAPAILTTGLFTGRVSKDFLGWRDFAEKNPDLPVGMILQGATTTDLTADVIAAHDARSRANPRQARPNSRCWHRRRRIRSEPARCVQSEMRCRDGTRPPWSHSPTRIPSFRIPARGRCFATSSHRPQTSFESKGRATTSREEAR